MSLAIRELRLDAATRAGWDDFARRCGGSMEVSSAWLRGWQFRHRGQVRLLVVEDDAGVRVGQAAVTEARGVRTLHDRLLLAPGQEGCWAPAMQALLRRLGPGACVQGSRWSPAPPQSDALAALPGVEIEAIESFVVQAVDFDQWPDWDSYWRSVSRTLRQTVQAAETRDGGVELAVRAGRRAVIDVPQVVLAAFGVQRRKAVFGEHWYRVVHAGGTLVTCRDHLAVASVRQHGRLVASNASVEFGRVSHLLVGGVRAGASGGWCSMKALLQRAQAQGPGAKFVMGAFEPSLHDEAAAGGLLRSRRACRVSDLPAARTRFHYHG